MAKACRFQFPGCGSFVADSGLFPLRGRAFGVYPNQRFGGSPHQREGQVLAKGEKASSPRRKKKHGHLFVYSKTTKKDTCASWFFMVGTKGKQKGQSQTAELEQGPSRKQPKHETIKEGRQKGQQAAA